MGWNVRADQTPYSIMGRWTCSGRRPHWQRTGERHLSIPTPATARDEAPDERHGNEKKPNDPSGNPAAESKCLFGWLLGDYETCFR